MANELIGFEVQGLAELQAKLAKLPKEAQDAMIDEVNAYMLNVMRAYAPYKSVTRRQAYGETFFSDKQRRFFFAALNDGRIQVPYRRTQTLSRGWRVLDKGASSMLYNEVSYAKYVQDTEQQARLQTAIGWKGYQELLKERMAKILQVADAGVKKALKKLKLV